MEMITVNANGQVTLPAKERKKLGLAPGTTVTVIEQDNGLLLKKAKAVNEDVFEKIRKIAEAKNLSEKDIVKICKEIRKNVYREEYGK
ncbi:MAG: AbrB/MazE/SpoVT family DNA-binding domain-containing protein [Candidatus Micrarchaeia archaeon]